MQFENIHNFRDLGGVRNQNGQVVKNGLLFRSGELGIATAHDFSLLRQLNLQTIVDYRDDEEFQKVPTPSINTINIIRAPARKKDSVIETASMKELVASGALNNFSLHQFEQFYAELPFNNPAYQTLLQSVIDRRVPLLQHCTAGKDRTGVGTMLVYLLFDVPFETIMDDYLKTNAAVEKNPPKWMAAIKDYIKDPQILKMLVGVQPELLQSSYDAIIQSYQTPDTYLYEQYGITPLIKEAAQHFYLK